MTYIVQVWEGHSPASVEEAERIHRQLAGQQMPQNPKFIELAQRLTQRFPCMSTMDEDDAEDAVWTDAPLDGRTPHPCYGLGIRTEALTEVMPLLVAEARALDLVVYDMQAACVHLPDGRVLGHCVATAGSNTVLSDDPVFETKKQLLDSLKAGLQACMSRHGFEPAPLGFVKKGKGLSQELMFDIGFYGSAGSWVRLFVGFELKLKTPLKKAVDKLTSGLCSLVLPTLFKACKLPSFDPRSKVGVEFTVTRASEARALTAALSECLDPLIFEILSRCQSIQQLADEFEADRLRPERTLVSYTQADVVVAFLTNRSAYESLIDKSINEAMSEYQRDNIVALKAALSELAAQESRP